MGQKLHRGRRNVFHKKHPGLKVVGWVVIAAAIVAVGFFGAKYITEHPPVSEPESSEPTVTTHPTEKPSSDTSAESSTPAAPETPEEDLAKGLRGFTLPLSHCRDLTKLTETLSEAKEAGMNAVVLPFKDEEGTLYFLSETAAAAQVNSFSDNALSLDDVTALFTAVRETGLAPVARLYAFRDNAAARKLAGARISHASNSGWVWYDNAPDKGGKAWLNPYADEAHLYILDLCDELVNAGAGAILLDGVQFPAQTSSAGFGTSANTSLSKGDMLAAFVEKARTILDCPVIVSSTALGALGNNTAIYGANPLTFAPSVSSPEVFPAELPKKIKLGDDGKVVNDPDDLAKTVEDLVTPMALRIKVLSKAERSLLAPFLQAYDLTAAQIKDEITGCKAAGCTSYILHDPKGKYDFAALGK